MKLMAFKPILLISLLIVACQPQSTKNENQIRVFCAAGLTNVIMELNDSISRTKAIDIKLNLASSGTLARQIEQGNPADIYISASSRWADYGDSLGLFDERKTLGQNKLVLISPLATRIDEINFTSEKAPVFNGYLAMGDPGHVPAGKYAREALNYLNWWDKLKPGILATKDVRSALMLVELGECELGIVYYSDAISSKKVKIVGIFPDSTHTPIIFHALLSDTASEAAKEYYSMLSEKSSRNIWRKHGIRDIVLK